MLHKHSLDIRVCYTITSMASSIHVFLNYNPTSGKPLEGVRNFWGTSRVFHTSQQNPGYVHSHGSVRPCGLRCASGRAMLKYMRPNDGVYMHRSIESGRAAHRAARMLPYYLLLPCLESLTYHQFVLFSCCLIFWKPPIIRLIKILVV